MTVEDIIEKVCKECKFYNKHLGICKGELLPVEEAILINAAGRGLCDDVKKFIIAEGGKIAKGSQTTSEYVLAILDKYKSESEDKND